MKQFWTELEEKCTATKAFVCVGLDPNVDPGKSIDANASAMEAECLKIVAETHSVVPIYKPNSAFFEQMGASGLIALDNVIAYIKSLPTRPLILLDAKRGDIDKSSAAYARGAFTTVGADAVTFNPYMGRDSLQPFLDYPTKGVFVICKTSNPGSNDFQTLKIAGDTEERMLYEVVAQRHLALGGSSEVGFVVGATDADAMTRVRRIAPNSWLLCPGVGSQGGTVEHVVKNALLADSVGIPKVIFNVSRKVQQASDRLQECKNLNDEFARAYYEMASRPLLSGA